jgi:hypothetical protein
MNATLQKQAVALLERVPTSARRAITAADLAGLPAPVRRYLTYARIVGREPIRTVRLKQRGAMRRGEGQGWIPLVAEQYFTADPPAFLWHGTLHLAPLVSLSGTDTYADGHGTMVIRALSVLPLGTARGPETDQGELVRYLGEIAWFPTAALAPDIRWEAIDVHSAQATMTQPGVHATVTYHVDDDGRCTHLTAQRYREERKRQVLRPWIARWDNYREINGLCIPTTFEVSWTLEAGEFRYIHGEVTEIEHNQAVPYGYRWKEAPR